MTRRTAGRRRPFISTPPSCRVRARVCFARLPFRRAIHRHSAEQSKFYFIFFLSLSFRPFSRFTFLSLPPCSPPPPQLRLNIINANSSSPHPAVVSVRRAENFVSEYPFFFFPRGYTPKVRIPRAYTQYLL